MRCAQLTPPDSKAIQDGIRQRNFDVGLIVAVRLTHQPVFVRCPFYTTYAHDPIIVGCCGYPGNDELSSDKQGELAKIYIDDFSPDCCPILKEEE